MKTLSLENELNSNAYPGRGIVIRQIGRRQDCCYRYILSWVEASNSRNRVFTETA